MGTRTCIEELVRYLTETGLDGAACQSQGVSGNFLARMEERLFDEVSRIRLAPAHWSKIFLRGSILSRRAYLDVGGFETRYGLFAEPELSARLHARGYTLGYASAAVVRHSNTTRIAELRASVREYVHGECAYRLDHPDGGDGRYLGRLTGGASGVSLTRA